MPSLISALDKPNREIFKDCQKFYLECKQQHQLSDSLACNSCLAKTYLPLKCRAAPTQGCFQETVNFLNSFKAKLTRTARAYMQRS